MSSTSPARVLFEGDGWSLEVSEPLESGGPDLPDPVRVALGELHERIPFGPKRLQISERRDPDPLRLRVAEAGSEGGVAKVYLVRDAEGEARGSLVLVTRPARVGSDLLPVGHLTDVRFDPIVRRARVFPTVLHHALEDCRRETGAEVFYTAVLSDDDVATRAFLMRREARFEQPMAQVMSRLCLGLVPLGGPDLGAPRLHVQRASDVDLDELVAFLERNEGTRRLGHEATAASLARRFQQWPGFGISSFFVARRAGARIVGCAAVLDPTSLRRFELSRRSSLARRYNLSGLLHGHSRLPRRGAPLSVGMLTHLDVDGEDPATLRDLICGIHAELSDSSSLGWLGLAVPCDVPLENALEVARPFRVGLSLLALSRAGSAWNNFDFRTSRPGFEPAFG